MLPFVPTCEPSGFPSFSIILETENLSTAELEGVYRSLHSIAAQDLSPHCAREVLIMESGDVPKDMMERLCHDFPWLTVRSIQADMDYYAAKMKGVSLTTGDVIILADSDCVYEPTWLRSLLTPFIDSTVNIVAGETTTSAAGPYGLAMALTYIFPRFTRRHSLLPARFYFCNNVAFRRDCLLAHPIPTSLPIYRGNCVIHAHALTRHGETIWQQPHARARHAAPNGLAHFTRRFVLLGYDALMMYRLRRAHDPNGQVSVHPVQDLGVCSAIALARVKQVTERLVILARERPANLLHLPIASFIALASLLLFSGGLAIGYVRPHYFLGQRGRVEVPWEPSGRAVQTDS